jgi:hypothetical protein
VFQQDSAETAAKKQRFVANLQKLMAGRGLSVSETAYQANIDRKRFYRWATSGIARASKSHIRDLNNLRWLFGLTNWQELWGDEVTVSVEEQLIAAASAKPDYGYAAKVLFLLGTLGRTDSGKLREHIDKLFEHATRDEMPEQMLRVLSAKQVLDRVRTLSPSAYSKFVAEYGDQTIKCIEQVLVDTPAKRIIPSIVKQFQDLPSTATTPTPPDPPPSDPIPVTPLPTSIGGGSLPIPEHHESDDEDEDDDDYGEGDEDDYDEDDEDDEDYDDDE